MSPTTTTSSRPHSLSLSPCAVLFGIFWWGACKQGQRCCIMPTAPRGYEASLDILANDVSVAASRQIGLWQLVGTGRTPPPQQQQRVGGSCCSSLCSDRPELRGRHVLLIRPGGNQSIHKSTPDWLQELEQW